MGGNGTQRFGSKQRNQAPRRALLSLAWVGLLALAALGGMAFRPLQATPPPPAATPQPTARPTLALTPTPTFVQLYDGQRYGELIWRLCIDLRWWIVLIALAALVVFLGLAFVKGLGKGMEDLAKRLVAWLWSILPGRDPHTRSYLNWFILRYQDPKFGPRSLAGQYSDQRPARLEDIYLPIEVAFTANEAERAALGEDKPALAGPEGVLKERQVDLFQAIRTSRTLVVIGHAGSGKSTLLQWAGRCSRSSCHWNASMDIASNASAHPARPPCRISSPTATWNSASRRKKSIDRQAAAAGFFCPPPAPGLPAAVRWRG